ncbi:MAG TPA: hypothetical protein PKY13_01220 [Microthrixaceae bacterium]|nr:hypothetical protein [Microthrixaceae bacterium]
MSVATRQLTALVALGLAMLLAAGCGATQRTELTLSGADAAPDDLARATTSPPAAAAAPDAGATTVVEPTTEPPAATAPTVEDAESAAALSAPASSAGATPTTSRAAPPTTDPDARLLDEVEAAVGRQDICGVYAGLARFELATASTDRLIAQLTRIRTIMLEASSFVTPALAADWAAVTEGMTGLLTSLEEDRAVGKVSKPSHYDDDDYREASGRVADWMGRNCA